MGTPRADRFAMKHLMEAIEQLRLARNRMDDLADVRAIQSLMDQATSLLAGYEVEL